MESARQRTAKLMLVDDEDDRGLSPELVRTPMPSVLPAVASLPPASSGWLIDTSSLVVAEETSLRSAARSHARRRR